MASDVFDDYATLLEGRMLRISISLAVRPPSGVLGRAIFTVAPASIRTRLGCPGQFGLVSVMTPEVCRDLVAEGARPESGFANVDPSCKLDSSARILGRIEEMQGRPIGELYVLWKAAGGLRLRDEIGRRRFISDLADRVIGLDDSPMPGFPAPLSLDEWFIELPSGDPVGVFCRTASAGYAGYFEESLGTATAPIDRIAAGRLLGRLEAACGRSIRHVEDDLAVGELEQLARASVVVARRTDGLSGSGAAFSALAGDLRCLVDSYIAIGRRRAADRRQLPDDSPTPAM